MSNVALLHAPSEASGTPRWQDVVELCKPRITSLVLLTTIVGAWIMPSSLPAARLVLFLVAMAGLVASANALNCCLERETDGLMQRTCNRPLPAGRMRCSLVAAAATLAGCLALALMWAVTNPLTALLGAIAWGTYVGLYTPLKRVSPWALAVGAVPGALPPMMGATAASGVLSASSAWLFGILFFWQLPHFIAIAITFKDDYRRGGLKVLPVARGERAARRHLFGTTLLLVIFSLAACWQGWAGTAFRVTATAVGAGFMFIAWRGLTSSDRAWSRRAFAYSLVYLVAVIGALVLDAR
jgi:protoheme IX farnesyltransferase